MQIPKQAKFVTLVSIFMGIIILVFSTPFSDPVVGIYDDFFASRDTRGAALIYDIPIDDLHLKHETAFKLPLRRNYSLSLGLMAENSVHVEDANSSIIGVIEMVSEEGELLKRFPIPASYQLKAIPEKLEVFSYRAVGRNGTKAVLVIKDLKLTQSPNLRSRETKGVVTWPTSKKTELEDLRIRVSIKPEAVLMH